MRVRTWSLFLSPTALALAWCLDHSQCLVPMGRINSVIQGMFLKHYYVSDTVIGQGILRERNRACPYSHGVYPPVAGAG